MASKRGKRGAGPAKVARTPSVAVRGTRRGDDALGSLRESVVLASAVERAATRLSAAGISAVMLVAIYKIHWAHGFFLNISCVSGRGHGIEYNIALLGMALYLMIAGGGRWCLDRLVFR